MAKNKPLDNISVAILAGGKSTRMGQNKALIRIGGKAMIQRVTDTVQSQAQDVMIISNQTSAYAFLDLPVHPDAVKNRGPLGGIYTALLHAKHEHCLVLACDLPFVTPQLLQFLYENSTQNDVLVFESETGLEPLCAVYSKRCLEIIRQQIDAGQLSVFKLYDKVNTRIVRLNPEQVFYEPTLFMNVNTKQELQRAQAILKKTINPKTKKPV